MHSLLRTCSVSDFKHANSRTLPEAEVEHAPGRRQRQRNLQRNSNQDGGRAHRPLVSHSQHPVYNYEFVESRDDEEEEESPSRVGGDRSVWRQAAFNVDEEKPRAEGGARERVGGKGRVFVSNPQGRHWIEEKTDAGSEHDPVRRVVASARASTKAPVAEAIGDGANEAPRMEAMVQSVGDVMSGPKLEKEPRASADLYFFGRFASKTLHRTNSVGFLAFYGLPSCTQVVVNCLLYYVASFFCAFLRFLATSSLSTFIFYVFYVFFAPFLRQTRT